MNRGSCSVCGQLILEHVAFSPFSIVIGRCFDDPLALPPASGHLFYECRSEDVEDDHPRFEGYAASQLAFARWIASALFRNSPDR